MDVLIFAPHPDDEVLGCGGTIARLSAEGHDVHVCTVTKGQEPLFREEGALRVRSEQREAHDLLGVKSSIYLDFPAAMLEESHRYDLNGKIAAVVTELRPELVFLPHFGDMQKDHGLVAEAVMVAVRPKNNCSVKRVLAYETLTETEWNTPHSSTVFIPNCFYDISGFLDIKLNAIRSFRSQMDAFPYPRSVEAVSALAKLRGSTIGACAAEAFALIRDIR